MKLQAAIQARILELCKARKWSANKLAERSGISPSTMRRTVKSYASVENTTTGSILKMCQGFGISFKEFWDSPLFDNIDEAEEK